MTALADDFGFTSFADLRKDSDDFGFTPFYADKTQETEEGLLESNIRTASQIPQGLLEATPPGLAATLWQFLSMGEVLDPEEIENIKTVSEREGIPFDENAYYEAAQQALGSIPTVANIASTIEERTGAPLEPKEWYQKFLRLASLSGKLQPGTIGQKIVAGTTAGTTSELLKEIGVPEPFAELGGMGVGGYAGAKTPKIDIGKATKPSGMTARQFEKITEPREVSSKKLSQINEKLESDFKDISDQIIADSPIGETAESLANDPTFKQESRDLLNQAQSIADEIPVLMPSQAIKKELADISARKVKGYALNEYDKSYMKFMKEAINDIVPEKVSMGELVEQYRKNNASLGEYFEPGASKALNRAKRDALLDQNRAIANILEKSNPELSQVFKEGNQRWTKIMDTEAVDNFVNELFGEKVNFKKMHDFFDKQGYDRIFKRALGEEGYKKFEGLLKDMLTSEVPYKMLKIAKEKGFQELFETAGAFVLHPTLGKAKLGYSALKKTYKYLMNALLDKPQIGITWKKGIDNLKRGNFAQAENAFAEMKEETEAVKPSEVKRPEKTNKPQDMSPIIETEANKTPRAAGVDAFNKYGLTSFIEDAVKNGYINKLEDIEPYIRNSPTLLKKAQAIEEQLGKSLNEIIEDIYGKKFTNANEPQKHAEDRKLIGERPKELETKPKEEPKAESKFKETAKKIVEEKKKAEPQTELPKSTIEKKFPETRKQGEIFHGSPKEINVPETGHYSSFNYYGQGFYTTDALDIAGGYASRKGKAKNPTIYKVIEKKPVKLFNMEMPIPKEIKNDLQKLEYHQAIGENLSENPKQTLRELYDEIRQSGYSADDIQEEFQTIADHFERKGYDGYKHVGGQLTGKKPHEVKIYFDPDKSIKIEKIENPQEYQISNKTKKSEKKNTKKSLTNETIKEIKRQDISKSGLKAQKKFIIDKIADALKHPEKYHADKIAFDVPGDGEFRINNNPEALKNFQKHIVRNWPDKPLTDAAVRKLMGPTGRY